MPQGIKHREIGRPEQFADIGGDGDGRIFQAERQRNIAQGDNRFAAVLRPIGETAREDGQREEGDFFLTNKRVKKGKARKSGKRKSAERPKIQEQQDEGNRVTAIGFGHPYAQEKVSKAA